MGMIPNLLIAGAEKAGTTSLAYYLEEHPEIYFSTRGKETHFFDENYHRGLDWYISQFVEHDSRKYVVDATPLYLYLDWVPKLIYELMPDSKLIFVFRNPIDRAYSKYWHQIGGGFEWLDFRDALTQEDNRLAQSVRFQKSYSYMDAGRYGEQIERYLKYFSKEQMYFLLFEELKKHPQKMLDGIYSFLGVNKQTSGRVKIVKNRRKQPLSPWVQRKINYWLNIRKGVYLYKDIKPVWKVATKINMLFRPGSYPPMNEKDREYLKKAFESDMDKLVKITSMDLSSWDDG